MGKKNKKNMEINGSTETNEANVSSLLKISKLTDKNVNKNNEQSNLKCVSTSDDPDEKTEYLNNPTRKQKRNKRKSEVVESNTIAATSEKIVKSNESKPITRDSKTKNQKIVFSNDDMTKDVSKQPKAGFLNEDEAEVRDEDIDKFCDEITEEDNKIYENWVEMFEANFKKNKKT